jgi:hypothetical protein
VDYATALASRQSWIIGECGPRTHQDRVRAVAEPMDEAAGLRTRDPLRLAACGGDASIERGRKLERDEGPAALANRQKAAMKLTALDFENPRFDLDPGSAQAGDALPCYLGMGITASNIHA